MNRVTKSLLLGVGIACLLTACKPDKVGPKSEASNQPTIGQVAENEHIDLSPACSPYDTIGLISEDGSLTVNYCGVAPCAGTQPKWGIVELYNGRDTIMANFSLALGWFIDLSRSEFSLASNFSFSQAGIPLTSGDWISRDIDLRNKWQLIVDKDSIQMDGNKCTFIAVNLTVTKLSFFGGADPRSSRVLWGYNADYNSGGADAAPSPFLKPWCWATCPEDEPQEPTYPTDQCQSGPAAPSVTCTQTVTGGGININNASNVICVNSNANIGSVNYNGSGTLVIGPGVTVSGGINANNGGTLIVKGTFNWNQNANINGNFKIYIEEGGILNRSGDITMNNQGNQLVNRGTLNIQNNLTYNGSVYNHGILSANGLNVNSSNTRFINSGKATFAQFANLNSGTTTENCGRLDVGNNLEINGNSTFHNYCTTIARNLSHQNGNFHNWGVFVSGLTGGGDGYANQGNTTLYEGSSIIAKDFFWSTNQPLNVVGESRVIVASSTLSSEGYTESLGTTGRLRMSQGVRLSGAGKLVLVEANPNSSGDNPVGNHLSFPESFVNMVQLQNGASIEFRQAAQTDIPFPCTAW